MKEQDFEGVAVHPTQVSPKKPTMVGVWLARQITDEEREELMRENATTAPGHIGVRTSDRGTAIMYVGRIRSRRKARSLARKLAHMVVRVTGIRTVLYELPNYLAVSRTFAAV